MSMLMALILSRRQQSVVGYFIDDFGAPTAAYSLRLLSSSYAGNCIRVRRSSDNAEQDIGFSGAALDESALMSFVGASDGLVVTWYDQSGNANNATQSTMSKQPKIVSSGVIEKEAGFPVIASIDGNQKLDTGITGINTHTSIALSNTVNKAFNNFGGNYAKVWSTYYGTGALSSSDHSVDQGNPDQKIRYFSGGANIQITAKPGGRKILSAYRNGSEIGFAENDDTPTTAATSSTTTNTRSIMLMNDHDIGGSQPAEGPENISEFIIFDSDKSAARAVMVSNLNSYYSVH